MDDMTFMNLGKFLAMPNTLVALDVSENAISKEAASLFFDTMNQNKTLKTLTCTGISHFFLFPHFYLSINKNY